MYTDYKVGDFVCISMNSRSNEYLYGYITKVKHSVADVCIGYSHGGKPIGVPCVPFTQLGHSGVCKHIRDDSVTIMANLNKMNRDFLYRIAHYG